MILAHIDLHEEPFKSVIHEALRRAFGSVSMEQLTEHLYEVQTLRLSTDDARRLAIRDAREHEANALLIRVTFVKAVEAELAMWCYIKDGSYEKAWDCMVSAHELYSKVLAFRTELDRLSDSRKKVVEMVQRVHFPPQQFSSPGFAITASTCSICHKDSDGDECNHQSGLIYAGEFCCQNITGTQLREISLTKTPKDMRCRIAWFDSNGERFDTLSLNPLSSQTHPGCSDILFGGYFVRFGALPEDLEKEDTRSCLVTGATRLEPIIDS